jgi:CDP-2,3-bis-(O-geranylgeranyl)-sn-glycerol synthase
MNPLFSLFTLIYFFLPAYFANMTPPISKRLGVLKFLAGPVDFNKKFLGNEIFGSHKTWRGVILAVFVGFLTVFFQRFLFRFAFFQKISVLDYSKTNLFLFAFLISFGAVFGDLMFAFIKRRIGLKPGTPFFPFDQTNYVIGSAIFLEPFFRFGILFWLKLFVLTFFLHLIFNRLGYRLKIHQAKW